MDVSETSSSSSLPESLNSDLLSPLSVQESSSQASQPPSFLGTSTPTTPSGDNNDYGNNHNTNSERYTQIRTALLEAEGNLFGYSALKEEARAVSRSGLLDEVDRMALTASSDTDDVSTAAAGAQAASYTIHKHESGRSAEQVDEEVTLACTPCVFLLCLATWCCTAETVAITDIAARSVDYLSPK